MDVPQVAANRRPAAPTSRRPLIWLMGGMLALLAAGILVALTVGRATEATYPVGSPLRAASTYLRLLQDGKVDEAYAMTDAMLGPDGTTPMSLQAFHQAFDNWSAQSRHITVLRSTATRNTASVTVEIDAFSGDGITPSNATGRQTLTLRRTDGAWRITGPPYLFP